MAQDTQKTIVAQSQLKFVYDYTTRLNLELSLKEIVAITNVMSDYCINGYSKELSERLDAVDKFIREKSNKK
jgi:hypothetical protein